MIKWDLSLGCKDCSTYTSQWIRNIQIDWKIEVTWSVEMSFNKIQHIVMIKTLKNLGIEGMYLNIKKVICGKLIANILIEERLKSIILRSGTRQGNHSLFLFKIVLEVLAREIWQEKEIKERHSYQKGRSKIVSICRWYNQI